MLAASCVSVRSARTGDCFLTGAAFGAAAVAMVGGTWTTEGVLQGRSVCESVGRASGTNGLLTRLPAVVRVEVRAIVTVWKRGVDAVGS